MEHKTAEVVTGEVFNYGLLHLEWTTALFIFIVFIITMFCLNTLLFKPIIRTLDARKAKVDKDNEEVKRLTDTIETSKNNYQEKLNAINEKIRATRKEALQEAKEQASKKFENVKSQADKNVTMASKELANSKSIALDQVAKLSQNLARVIHAKVLS